MSKVSEKLVMLNQQGMHFRPAAEIVRIASQYDSEIHISKKGGKADLRSIFELVILGIQYGDELELIAMGPDAHEAVDAIVNFLNAYRDIDVGREASGDDEPDLRVA